MQALLARVTAPDGGIDTGADPEVTEQLGAQLAELVRPAAPSVVVSWDDVDDVVLAHVVARELGVLARRAALDMGTLGIDGLPTASGVVAVVATSYRPWRRPLAPVAVLLRQRGASEVIAAQLMPDPAAEIPADDAADITSLLTLVGSR